jgi:hypothetical protein
VPIKLKLGNNGNSPGHRTGVRTRLLRGLLVFVIVVLVVGAAVFGFMYFK